ncbi:MAG: NYN domain-containing protein [Thermoleophilia bacterium]
MATEHESSLAVLVDFENMARPGVKGRGDFDIHLVLNRLADKGRVLVKRAYADWSRYRDARHDLQNAGLELIEMPSAREGAKNRADIKMAVDAMELAFSREHLDTFVIVSGDSDFTPLVGKVRELNKRVIGVGNRESASELLIANCDEFIYYDLLAASRRGTSGGRTLDPNELLKQTLLALQREGTEWPLASVVKDSMRRRNPAFDETEANFTTFSKFLEDANARGLIRLESDPRSGTYRVELAEGGSTSKPEAIIAADSGDDGEGGGPRRRRRRRRGEGGGAAEPKPEVFEFVVEGATVMEGGELPDLPLDRALTYEDMIMMGPELAGAVEAAETPVLMEATDVDEPATTSRRRRRRRGGAEGEPAEAAPAATELTEEATQEAPPVSDEPAPEAPASRRRRRRGATAETTEQPAAAEPAEAPGEPEAQAEPAPEEAPAETTSRRRVRRGTRAVTAEPTAEAPAADATEAPAEDAAPKRRTRTRKAAAPEAPAPETTEAPAEEAAPKRRTRTRKAAAPEAPAPATTEAPAEEAAPKRRTRTRKAAAPEAPAPETTEAPAEDAAPKRRTRTRKAAAPEAPAE